MAPSPWNLLFLAPLVLAPLLLIPLLNPTTTAFCNASSVSTAPSSVPVGVVQFSHSAAATGPETQLLNAHSIGSTILNTSSALNPPRLLVFPELALGFGRCSSRSDARPFGGSVPVGLSPLSTNETGVVPCSDDHYGPSTPLGVISCAIIASSSPVDVVVGVIEVEECQVSQPGCPDDGYVVFDVAVYLASDGSVRAKYRKHHLFTESSCIDPGPFPGVTTVTPIAVSVPWSPTPIGLLVCFDMDFHDSVDALRSKGVRLLALPTAWVNVLPVCDAVSTQNAFTWRYPDLVLAAANVADVGNAGSGVYAHGSPLAYRFNVSAVHDMAVVVANVPREALQRGAAPLSPPPVPPVHLWLDGANNDPNILHTSGMPVKAVTPASAVSHSPCGPGFFSYYPTSNCSVMTVRQGESADVALEASTGRGLVCQVAFSLVGAAAASPKVGTAEGPEDSVTFAAYAVAFNTSGKYMEICSFIRCVAGSGKSAACSAIDPGLIPPIRTGSTLKSLSLSASFTVKEARLYPSMILSEGALGELGQWSFSGPGTPASGADHGGSGVAGLTTAATEQPIALDELQSMTLQAV